MRTGIRVRVLSNSEQRYVRIKGVIARENDFKLPEKGTAMVDIGAGSLQISIYEKKSSCNYTEYSSWNGKDW
ncbi:MAG: hypothetical protein ACLTRS_08090 [Lachnospiraceae bacterium]